MIIWHVPGDFTHIQTAIDAASDGDAVIVSAGTYVENLDFKGKAITVYGKDGSGVTFIDGGSTLPCVVFITGEGRDSRFIGFTLLNGFPYNIGYYTWGGAGIYTYVTSPTIMDVVITGHALTGGTAVAVEGIGICIHHPSTLSIPGPLLRNVIVNDCNAKAGAVYGGGVYVEGSCEIYNLLIHKCWLQDLGALFGWAAKGGGLYIRDAADVTLQNITIVDCAVFGAYAHGGALYVRGDIDSVVRVRNSVFWDCTADISGPTLSFDGVTPNIFEYNDDQEGYLDGSSGNVKLDPLFTNPVLEDYTLGAGSPCIDGGNPAGEYDDAYLPPGKGTVRNDIGYTGGPYNVKDSVLIIGSPCIDTGDPAPEYYDTVPPGQGTVRNDMGAYGGPGATEIPKPYIVTAEDDMPTDLSDIDVTKPSGTNNTVDELDDFERETREALVNVVGLQHHDDGIHKFPHGTTATKLALATKRDGMPFIDETLGKLCWWDATLDQWKTL